MSEQRAQRSVSDLLAAWGRGDQAARDALLPIVYEDLRRRAEAYLRRERGAHLLQPTALVHETYLKLVAQATVPWKDRVHFFSFAARLMRQILVDESRRRTAAKRGGGARSIAVSLDELEAPEHEQMDFERLDAALEDLARIDADQARIVELRFFGGLTIEETGAALGISPTSVKREWCMARAWLARELSA